MHILLHPAHRRGRTEHEQRRSHFQPIVLVRHREGVRRVTGWSDFRLLTSGRNRRTNSISRPTVAATNPSDRSTSPEIEVSGS